MVMAAILPEPPIRRHWTTDQVRDLMEESRPSPRYELIGGELFVTPSPGAPHQLAVTEIWRILDAYLTREAAGTARVPGRVGDQGLHAAADAAVRGG